MERQVDQVRELRRLREWRRNDLDLLRTALAQDALRLVGEELDELEAWQLLEIEASKRPEPRAAKHAGRSLGEVDRGEHLTGRLRHQLQVTGVRCAVNVEELRRVEQVSPRGRQEFVDENRVVVPSHLLRLTRRGGSGGTASPVS